MRRRRRYVLGLSVGVAAMVAVAAWAGAAFMTQRDATEPAPSFVEVAAEELDAGNVACVPERYFCITAESAAGGFALATVNQRSFSVLAHHGGCPAQWMPHFVLATVNGGTGMGAFRVPCDGQTWNAAGDRLFGPAPGDLTRLPLTRDDGRYVVDVRPLRAFLP